MKRKPKRVGGLQRKSAPVHNIKSARAAKGVGPARNSGGPGFTRSLPTHMRIRPGPPVTFAGATTSGI